MAHTVLRRDEASLSARMARWEEFCAAQQIHTRGVPLFASDGLMVQTMPYGANGRLVLQRSAAMEALVIDEVEQVIADFHAGAGLIDGIIYMMFWKDADRILPLYIGKSEKLGKKSNLSANIVNIRFNQGNFCRWGSNYAYHVGDLSAVVCPGHPTEKVNGKYSRWAMRLFESYPSSSPTLRRETFFWAKAWGRHEIGIWKEYGETSLTFLEYLLIGVASDLFPDILLNSEGVNRT